MTWRRGRAAAGENASRSRGRVLDGDGAPITDAMMIEVWQANAAGRL